MDTIQEMLFQISVKGLFFNTENKLMMVQEENGTWELPGGRVHKGEDLRDCLRRECLEETGLKCQILEEQPSIVYSALDQDGDARLMIFYRVKFDNLNFVPSDECVDIKFYTKDELKKLQTGPHILKLADFL